MAKIPDEERIQLEHLWANRAVRDSGSAIDNALWSAFRYTSRTHVHTKKRYVAWRVVEGAVEVLDVLRVRDVALSLEWGVGLTLIRQDGTQHAVTGTPSRPAGLDVFFWAPAFNEVRWMPVDWANSGSRRELRLAMNFKQARGRRPPIEGVHYLEEGADFFKRHPEHETTIL